ncbi:MAG: flagellar hook-length control protein FliK [Alcaligenaceae bacterium]|nr:flagellar hook-length control protein FliK [Alcaligenaceae bacterium]
MSIGAPSTLGTLLIQRLDAMLGTTLAQQANLVNGARPSAVTQPGNPENPDALRNPTPRNLQDTVDQVARREQGGAAIGKAGQTRTGEAAAQGTQAQTGATPSAPTSLGFAARTILALLAQYPQTAQVARGQAPLIGSQPAAGAAPQAQGPVPQGLQASPAWANLATALGEPGALSAQLTQSLSQALRTSGMFYESHLSDLTFGKTTSTAVRQEPQGRIPLGGTPVQAQATQAQAAQAGAATQAAPIPGSAATADSGASTAPSTTAGQGGTAAAGTPTIPGVDPQAQLLVRHQLDVLANQNFAWQGEAWPGAPMEWEIERRGGETDELSSEPEHWATRLNLQLPTLGNVQARLTLAGDQLVMHLTAPESADHLGRHIEGLRGSLLAHGLKAGQLSVAAHDDGPATPQDAHGPAAAQQ